MQQAVAEPSKRQLVISIHDVMPETLDRTESIVELLSAAGLRTVTLLVVPGKEWTRPLLGRLEALLDRGAIVAGHGWTHRADTINGFYHRLHSTLISRHAAEHLALDSTGIRRLIEHCYQWFGDNGLPVPTLYVPPAWAMGRIARRELDELPFSRYETLSGVYDAESHRFRRSPMVGFEADTTFRAVSCRLWNAANLAATGTNRPLRVAIHPGDLELELADDVRRLVAEGGNALSYDVFAEPSRSPATPRAERR